MAWAEATGQRPSDLGVYEQHQRRIRIVVREGLRDALGDRAAGLLLPVLERIPAPPLHLKLVRAPHAHAWIRSVDAAAALRVPGVVAVFSYPDSPARKFSTARHANPDDDPYDTLVLDRTVRFHGQRVAAVVAETVAAAEAGCALVSVDYEVLPAVTSPAAALAPGAPQLHPDLAPGNVCASADRVAGDPDGQRPAWARPLTSGQASRRGQ